MTLVERITSNTESLISGADIVNAIQGEVPIPTEISVLPDAGVLGLCINLITIVCHDEEDPIECILRVFIDGEVEATCLPGANERES
jgi:hypothetical protein